MAMVSLQSCYDRARRSMAQGEYDKAEAICQHILQYYPQDLGTFQLLGQINLERKQAREALGYFSRVLEIDPENVSAHWGMGIAYQDGGKVEEAIAEFEQALEIKPDLSDLRNQLLHLYTELYGAARAQLHLSRAGLGRLYVKGEMLDKAVEEFREVLKADPDRVDVQLSLLEVLWQRSEMEEAAKVSADVLGRLPYALKANLILGAIRMNMGQQEEGEQLWRQAVACDPNNTMARAIFEMAPVRISQTMLAFDVATLPDFDEEAWKARPVPVAAAPQPEEAAVGLEEEAAPVPPAAPAAEVKRPAGPEVVGVSWLDALATGEGRVEEAPGEEVPGIAPFSLEELGAAPAGVTAEAGAEFSLEGLEVLGAGPEAAGELPSEEEAVAPTPAPAAREDQVMRPFSLEELGLSPEEIAGLEEAVAAAKQEAPAPGAPPTPGKPAEELPEEELIPGLAPFSLEEIPAEAVAPAEAAIPGVEPFSLEGVGIGEEAKAEEAAPAALVGDLKPFSLEELGLEKPAAEAEPVSLEEIGAEVGEEVETGLPAFSWKETGTREAPAYRGELAPKEEEAAGRPSLFEKMMALRRKPAGPAEEAPPAEEEAPVVAEAELAGLKPFSLEEMGLAEAAAPVAAEEEKAVAEVQPFSLAELGLEEAVAPVAAEAGAEEVKPFSLAELGLEEPLAPGAAEAGAEEVKPFSLADLGLEEPTAAAARVEAGAEGVPAFSLEELGLEGPAPKEEAVPVAEAAAPAEAAVRPFTLEELGLTPEEIAGLGLSKEELAGIGMAPAEAAAPPAEAKAPRAAKKKAPPTVAEVAPPEKAVAAAAPRPSLEELRRQYAARPADESLRLALARSCAGQGLYDEAVEHYKGLIKSGKAGLEDDIVAGLQVWIEQEQDPTRLHRLHRLLGDAYMRKGWYQQAINEYAWVLSKV